MLCTCMLVYTHVCHLLACSADSAAAARRVAGRQHPYPDSDAQPIVIYGDVLFWEALGQAPWGISSTVRYSNPQKQDLD